MPSMAASMLGRMLPILRQFGQPGKPLRPVVMPVIDILVHVDVAQYSLGHLGGATQARQVCANRPAQIVRRPIGNVPPEPAGFWVHLIASPVPPYSHPHHLLIDMWRMPACRREQETITMI